MSFYFSGIVSGAFASRSSIIPDRSVSKNISRKLGCLLNAGYIEKTASSPSVAIKKVTAHPNNLNNNIMGLINNLKPTESSFSIDPDQSEAVLDYVAFIATVDTNIEKQTFWYIRS